MRRSGWLLALLLLMPMAAVANSGVLVPLDKQAPDPAILSLPFIIRKPLAWLIARRRAPIAREIYAKIGGRSPILEETLAQARALETVLDEHQTRVFVAMRCWKPLSDEAARAIKAWGADRIVLLPLYPQFSTTTSRSSLTDWYRASRAAGSREGPRSARARRPR